MLIIKCSNELKTLFQSVTFSSFSHKFNRFFNTLFDIVQVTVFSAFIMVRKQIL